MVEAAEKNEKEIAESRQIINAITNKTVSFPKSREANPIYIYFNLEAIIT